MVAGIDREPGSPAGGAGAPDAELALRLAELNAMFAAALPQTLAQLLELRNGFAVAQARQDVVDGMQRILHRLAGSAATFGFERLGDAARGLECSLHTLAATGDPAASAWASWLARLDRFVHQASADPHGAYPNDEAGV